MLIEQAFMALPEFLTGAPFKKYQNEGTVVTAFSMAVLQELNSRNVPNPVAALREEVNYPFARKWRADLHLDLAAMKIFTPELSSYGYYQNNWLEAKYSRLNQEGKPSISGLVTTLLLLKDIVRICALPPDSSPGKESTSGRYLLHAYQGDPFQYFSLRRNSGKKRDEREWITSLLVQGASSIRSLDIHCEKSKTFESHVGKHTRLIRMSADVTNIAHSPRDPSADAYYIVLTRVDNFSIRVGSRCLGRRQGVIFGSHPDSARLVPAAIAQLLAD
ncbi:hypothetical protein [Cyanobium sp. Cruz-8D1]|nr:hypothetical protein [Cyanobium sp. Cruz-8D1]